MKIFQQHKIQFITPGISEGSPELLKSVLASGVKWIQLRHKGSWGRDEIGRAEKMRNLTHSYEGVFIVNDQVEIAKELKADGVHLGKNDTDSQEARKILGEEVLIGGTANSLEDIETLEKKGVNYIGLGPFRFTPTKKNLSPVLGIEGYNRIMKDYGGSLPVFAIGGIKPEDSGSLLKCGLSGVAVSSFISSSENPGAAAEAFVKKIKN